MIEPLANLMICYLDIRKLFNVHTQLLADPHTFIYQRKGKVREFVLKMYVDSPFYYVSLFILKNH